MLVRFLGFSIETPQNLSLDELMTNLGEKATHHQDVEGTGRFLFVDATSDTEYYLGLIVTVKSQRTFCQLRESAGSFKVQVHELDENANIMDFNFFIINKKSGIGLYQHYHQSCSIGQGMNLLKKQFNKIKLDKRDVIKDEKVANGVKEDKATKLANQFVKGSFKWQMLIRKEKLENVLNELQKIKALEMDFSYLEPDSSEFGQLSSYVRKQRRKFSFVTEGAFSSLVKSIVAVVDRSEAEEGRIYGTDKDGLDRVIKIQNNPDNFGEYDYDEVASHINNLNVSNFKSSWIIKSMREVCEGKQSIFGAKIK